ncbi:MAG: fatty acid desaturase, partial [Candidatus Tectomicrobia bacterium]|nr:fatty acid desaturase [Candidatus Tectomicrobia bacterium]
QPRRKLAIHRKEERRIQWGTVTIIGLIHVGALLALRPDLYSTSGLVLFGVLYLMTGMFGVTMCYHRLLTHRSFQTHRWVEYFLTFCACQALQSGPISWTALHRIHHKEADDEPDPHSPLVSFLWAHMGWLFVDTPGASTHAEYSRFAKDLDRDPVQRFFDRYFFFLYLLTAALVYAAGELSGGLGLSWLVWGVLLRTVFLWHATWLVNSATHLWGYRNYTTDEDSTNNWWAALISFGEGWHNNHHADPRSARHGQRWFEVDVTYLVIRLLGRLGLAWQIMEPRKGVVARRVDIMVDTEALRLADERAREALRPEPVLHTQTDPTIPVEVPVMASAAEAYEAAVRSAREAKEAVEDALRHAAEALRHRRQEAAERMDQQVRQMLERAKDMAMAAVEKAKFAAAEASEFASQASAFAASAKDRAAGSARHAAEQSRILAQEAAEAAARAAEEIAAAFKGISRPVISSAI